MTLVGQLSVPFGHLKCAENPDLFKDASAVYITFTAGTAAPMLCDQIAAVLPLRHDNAEGK